MKVLLDIKDNKALHLLEVLKGLPYVRTKTLTNEKALLLEEIKEGVEEVNLINEGKKQARNAEDFLNELWGKIPWGFWTTGHNCYKVRIAIKSKGKGKSGGGRIVTFVKIEEERVYLLTMFDKSEKASISNKELEELLGQIPI